MKAIEVNDLEKLFKMVIKQLRILENLKKIDVEIDMYRFIPTDKWQSFEQEPLQGSLYDDLEELQRVLSEPDNVISYVDFDRIASILHYISEKMNPVNDVPFEESKAN